MNSKQPRIRGISIALPAALICAALLTAGFFLIPDQQGEPDNRAVATVNGDGITAGELDHFAGLRRASVMEAFMSRYGVEFGEGFWWKKVEDQDPLDILRQQALAEAVRMKVELQAARKYGLIQDTSFNAILAEMEKENGRRKIALEAGEPLYGPARFEPDTFVDFYRSKLSLTLKEKLGETELAATEEQLSAHYEAVKRELFPVEDRIRYDRVTVAYRSGAGGEGGPDKKRLAKQAAEEIRDRLVRGQTVSGALTGLTSGYPESAITFEEDSALTKDNASRLFKSEPQLYGALKEGTPDQPVLPLIDDQAAGCYAVVHVNSREAGDYPAFREVKAQVEKHYRDAAYDRYLDNLVQAAEVTELDAIKKLNFGLED